MSNTNENEDWEPILRSVSVASTSGNSNFHEKGVLKVFAEEMERSRLVKSHLRQEYHHGQDKEW